MFNKHLMPYQIFIKNSPAKCTLQKTFLACKIKMKSLIKIMKQPLRAKNSSTKRTAHTINNKTSKILKKHPQRSPPPLKRQTCSLQLYWIWFTQREFHKVYLKFNDYLRKTFEWLPSNIQFTIKVKILFTKFTHIFR